MVDKLIFEKEDLVLPRLCLGGCPMGMYGWGPSKEDDFIDAIHYAIDNGLNYFDTADVYGLGTSEIILGKAVASRRKDVIIQTKFGVRRQNNKTFYDCSAKWMEESLNASLKRLCTTYVDILVMHYYDGHTPIKEIIDMFLKLRAQGKVRFFGISNIKSEQCSLFEHYKEYILNFQKEFSLANRTNEDDISKISKSLDAFPLTWGSLGQGILTGAINKNTVFDKNDRRLRPEYINFQEPNFSKNLEIVEKMKPIASIHNTSISSVAIRYILDSIPNSIPIVGFINKAEVKENARALGWNLSFDELSLLNEVSKK